jgi:hypothetical protein
MLSGGKSPSYVLVSSKSVDFIFKILIGIFCLAALQVGDTGERDEEAGERIIAKHGRAVRAVFLHAVSDSRDRSRVSLPADRIYKGIPVYYFRTYVGAASKACSGGLISTNALKRVIVEAEKNLSALESKKTKPLAIIRGGGGLLTSKSEFLQSRRLELEADISLALKVNKIYRSELGLLRR